MYDYFEKINVHVDMVLDKHPENYRQDKFWKKKKIKVGPANYRNDTVQASSTIAVCISTVPYSDVYNDLYNNGWSKIYPVYDISEAYTDRHPLSNGWFAENIEKDLPFMEAVVKTLHDDESRAHYLQFVAWYCLRQDWIFEGTTISKDNRYFIKELTDLLTEDEVFVDVGACTGETILKFAELTNYKFKYIVGIEPDNKNYSKLLSTWLYKLRPQSPPHSIMLYKIGIGNIKKARVPFFRDSGYCSCFTRLGQRTANVTTIDHLWHSIDSTYTTLSVNPNITIIKYHIEGMELEALEGSEKTLQEHRPIILVSCYHNRDSLHKIPIWVKDKLQSYRLIFRLHGWGGNTNAVLYGIPEDRYRAKNCL